MTDNNPVSDEIIETSNTNSLFPSDEELRAHGIDPSGVYRIHKGTHTPLPAYLAQVEQAVDDILQREEGGRDAS